MFESLSRADATGLLRRCSDAGGVAHERLIHAVEGELRRIAAAYMRWERRSSTRPTAFVAQQCPRSTSGERCLR
jgi:hypothetical protein